MEQQQDRNLGALLAGLVDDIDVSILEFDMDYRIRSCNKKASQLYGTNIIGERCYRVLGKRTSPCANCPVNKVYETQARVRAIKKHTDCSGKNLYVDHIATPVFNSRGELTGVVALLLDITRQKEAEEELHFHRDHFQSIARAKEADLRESENKFALAFNVSPDAITINRLKDGLFVEVNRGFTELTGFTKKDIQGKCSADLEIFHNPLDRLELVKRLDRDGYCENLEALFRRKDGSLAYGLMSARVMHLGASHMFSQLPVISVSSKSWSWN